MTAGPEQFQGGVVADLDPATGQHGVTPRQVNGLFSPLPVELGAIRTQGVVEEMDPVEVPLADVTTAGHIEPIDEVLAIPLGSGGQFCFERLGWTGLFEMP